LTWRELQSDHDLVAAHVKRNQAAAFVLEGRVHTAPAESDTWTMHGIIAAQRRAAGNVWLVTSGLAGPATNAVATMVREITAELPWSRGKASKVLWVPVKVEIKTGESSPLHGDVREVANATFDGEPRIWPEEEESGAEQVAGR
jgi:hypothetical protein